jgi:imidazolonepropionase-like amidohydrolase/Tol biopolymer transport system component
VRLRAVACRTAAAVWLSASCAAAGDPRDARESRAVPQSADSAAAILVREGTALYFDVLPDGSGIVIDLLGQLWVVPPDGGRARALTDALGEQADHRQPAVSPDGRWIATRSDGPAGRGIRLHEIEGERRRQVTDSALVLGGDDGVPAWLPDGQALIHHRRGALVRTDLRTRTIRPLLFDSLENRSLDEPAISADGRRLLATGPWPSGSARPPLESPPGASIWEIDLESGTARRLTGEDVAARAPAYDPTGLRIAYFEHAGGSFRLQVLEPGGEARLITTEPGIEPRRVRWSVDGRELYFVAAGRLRRVPAGGGPSREVPFAAELAVKRVAYSRAEPRLPAPGERVQARGYGGVALAPYGDRVALLALGRLWIVDLEGNARATAEVPVSAAGLHWSPDGRAVLWSDGVNGADDLWVTDVESGASRRLTRLPGVEVPIGWSPDGAWIAFAHDDRLRALPAHAAVKAEALDLGPSRWSETAAFGAPYHWLPRGDTLLVYGMNGWPVAGRACVEAALVTGDGVARPVREFPCRPAHATFAADGSLITVERGLLVRHTRTDHGWGPGAALGDVPALNPSAARTGALLYVAPDGLRLRGPEGGERTLGWPLRFDAPPAPPLLLRNVRIVPLDEERTGASDILVVEGRIAAIGVAGSLALPPGSAGDTLDADGRWVMPGLIDTHLHFYDTDDGVPRAALRHGVTTIRDMWGRLGIGAAFRDAVDAGVLPGARIVVSGPPFYPSPTALPVTSDFLWLAADSADADRGLALLAGMGAGHVKMRYVQSWSAGARLVRLAHAHGLSVSGHCAHALPVVLAGIDGLEHADGQCGEWEFGIHDDIGSLYQAAGTVTAPIIHLHSAMARTGREQDWTPAQVAAAERRAERARRHAEILHAAGARIVAGSDSPAEPGALHGELESLVAAGLSSRAALRAATLDAAVAVGLGGQIGRVQVGYVADLLLLDGNPVEDIRNSRRVHVILQGGRIAVESARQDEWQGIGVRSRPR